MAPPKLSNKDLENAIRKLSGRVDNASQKMKVIDDGLQELCDRKTENQEHKEQRRTDGIRQRYQLMRMRFFSINPSHFRKYLGDLSPKMDVWGAIFTDSFNRLELFVKQGNLRMVDEALRTDRQGQGEFDLFLGNGKQLEKALKNSIVTLEKNDVLSRLIAGGDNEDDTGGANLSTKTEVETSDDE